MTVRIILCDDHKIVRAGIRQLIEEHQADIDVVAEADDGIELIKLVQKFAPDLVITDIMMPSLNGINAARQLLSQNPDVKIIALSMYADLRYVKSIMKIGASGYLTKDCSSEELLSAISTIMAGDIYVSHEIATSMVKDSLSTFTLDDISGLYTLSPTEREVLQLLSEGVKASEIASKMHISIHTVNTHRQKIMKKTGINNIAQLTKFAIKEGLTSI